MSIFYKEEQRVSHSEGKYTTRKVRGWAKWTVYISSAFIIGVTVNHFTGDKTGLEKLVTGSGGSSQVVSQAPGAKPYAKQEVNPLEALIAKFKAEYPGEQIGVVWVEKKEVKNGKETGKTYITPSIIIRDVTDNSYTGVKKVLFGDLKEGDLVITGYANPSAKTAAQSQTGPSALQSMQRILR